MILFAFPEGNCSENYIGEIRPQISERIVDHNGRDQKLHISNIALKNAGNTFTLTVLK